MFFSRYYSAAGCAGGSLDEGIGRVCNTCHKSVEDLLEEFKEAKASFSDMAKTIESMKRLMHNQNVNATIHQKDATIRELLDKLKDEEAKRKT